ncbi:hypothetical protein HY229_03175 [Candidatus Acetothermia bacterium]|nr:hypothetical protein [Candidatus Acetothermia bacterium]MBI3643086.1 hypothetical protein [Candidatus Acetothermia bacterium]
MALEVPKFDIDKYKKAIEKTLAELPVENGIITFENLWLELTLPEDLMFEILTRDDLILPSNVERVITKEGKTLAEQKPSANGSGSLAHP